MGCHFCEGKGCKACGVRCNCELYDCKECQQRRLPELRRKAKGYQDSLNLVNLEIERIYKLWNVGVI